MYPQLLLSIILATFTTPHFVQPSTIFPVTRSFICPKRLPQNVHKTRSSERSSAVHILNGDSVSPDLLRSIVIVHNETLYCTGTITGNDTLTTSSGRCVMLGQMYAIFYSGTDGVEAQLNVSSVHYQSTSYRGIAILKLSESIPSFSKILPITANNSLPVPRSFSRVAGYGYQRHFTPPTEYSHSIARQVDIPIMTTAECSAGFPTLTTDGSRFVCAGYRTSDCSTCLGDNGGPLIQYDSDGNALVVGISSFGTTCSGPSGFVRIAQFVDHYNGLNGTKYINSTRDVFYDLGSDRGNQTSTSNTARNIGISGGAVGFVVIAICVCCFCASAGEEKIEKYDVTVVRRC